MKTVVGMALLCGLPSAGRLEEAPRIPRPHWIIVATFTDRTTGQLLEQSAVAGNGLRLTSSQCMKVLHQVKPVQTHQVTVVLTCERVGPTEVDL
jgi:hypothetical protein